ncbi:hypothetical protein C8Q74DRAFT_661519 [Fomes fomentarius]|nr:hypothetical protein C8Q74DRAFT_661519 [Fomes fomentarius]
MLFSTPRRSRKLHQSEERVVIFRAFKSLQEGYSTGARMCILVRRGHRSQRNAGLWLRTPRRLSLTMTRYSMPKADKAAIERAIDTTMFFTRTNYTGPAIAAATFIPALVSSQAPSIVHISSLAALLPAPTISLYHASKAAALGLYRSLAILSTCLSRLRTSCLRQKGDAPLYFAADGVDPNSYGTVLGMLLPRRRLQWFRVSDDLSSELPWVSRWPK